MNSPAALKNLDLYHARATHGETEALVARHTPLVKRIAHHLSARLPASVSIADLIQSGLLGLLEAARRYDPAQGASFATFAELRIRGAMLDDIRRGAWGVRSGHRKAREVAAAIHAVETATGTAARDQDVAERLGLSLAEYHEMLANLQGQKLIPLDELDPDQEDGAEYLVSPEAGPEQTAQREELLRRLATTIDTLPERERLVLSLYYHEELNLKEIGAVLGVSESRVSQLHSQALVRLRARVHEGR